VISQIGWHNIKQVCVHTENRDYPVFSVDVFLHSERNAIELINSKKPHRFIARRQHFGSMYPTLVKLKRFGIRGTKHRAILVDGANIFNSAALVNEQAYGLQRRGVAAHRAPPYDLVQRYNTVINCNLRPP
jgi:hypothetical protein